MAPRAEAQLRCGDGQRKRYLQNSRKPLACARHINPALKQQPLLSRDREGAVPFARFSHIASTSEACPIAFDSRWLATRCGGPRGGPPGPLPAPWPAYSHCESLLYDRKAARGLSRRPGGLPQPLLRNSSSAKNYAAYRRSRRPIRRRWRDHGLAIRTPHWMIWRSRPKHAKDRSSTFCTIRRSTAFGTTRGSWRWKRRLG